MEAQLIDPAFAACPAEPLQRSGLAEAVDRYLLAAGLADTASRARLTAVIVHDLTAKPRQDTPGWAEIIAAVDRRLSAELAAEASGMETASARGRVALGLGEAGRPAGVAQAWGTPPRRRRVMPAQDLSRWRPQILQRLRGLLQFRVSPSAQGLAACLCCLAVTLIP